MPCVLPGPVVSEGPVIVLHEAMAKLLSKQLGVSTEFVEICQTLSISVPQGKALLAWFLTQPPRVRLAVMKGVVRETRKGRRRR